MKIAILSSEIILGFYEPILHPQGHALAERAASVDDLSHHSLDYEALTQTLKKYGVDYRLVAWSDPTINWNEYDAVLIHSPWDYYENKDAFMRTLQKIETTTLLLNSLDTVTWNIDKHYLQDAQHYGIHVIKTVFVNPDQVESILEVIPADFWLKGCVFKPTVSAGAMDVYLIKDKASAQECYLNHFKNKHAALMIQPFMDEIKNEGEWSFIFFDGKYSHGVLKKTSGDGFGVKHSTENQHHKPTLEMIDQATAIFDRLVKARKDNPLYTRLDTIRGADGKLAIMEIEQIEPYLYLHARAPEAANDLVQGLLNRIKG